MEHLIAFILAFVTSVAATIAQLLPGPKMAEITSQPNATTQTALVTNTPSPTATHTPTITPVPQTGWVRIYVQAEEYLPYPASVQGDCDYNNPARKSPPCRGGYPGYVITLYETATNRTIQSPPTDAKGWVTVYLQPGNYYFYRSIRGGQPYLPEAHRNDITIVAGKGVGDEQMIIVEP